MHTGRQGGLCWAIKMTERIFDFCERFSIRVRASDPLLERIAGNIQIGKKSVSPSGLIEIHEPEKYETITKDKRYPYLTTKINPVTGAFEYYRYNTFVRSIRAGEGNFYDVHVNVQGDETAALICFRNFCNSHPLLADAKLVHATLVNLDGEGILMSGDTRSGKTTLMVYLMQQFKAGLISEDNVYLERNMEGLYFPKVPRIRFSTIRDSCLSPLLINLEQTDATQYWDIDSIEKVVAQGTLDIDGGLAISRRKLAEMCGVGTLGSTKVDKVIFPWYSQELSFKEIGQEEGFKMLEKIGREKKRDLDPRDIEPEVINLSGFERRNIRFYRLGFGGFKELVSGGFAL